LLVAIASTIFSCLFLCETFIEIYQCIHVCMPVCVLNIMHAQFTVKMYFITVLIKA
jgi:hypothetical protein